MIWLLLIFAFVPALIYLGWIRKTERFEVESWIPLIISFVWGATVSVVISMIVEIGLSISLINFFENGNIFIIFLGVVVAPIIEEFSKPLGLSLRAIRKNIDELEDGLIYGAASGLGFSATENLLYGIKFMDQGVLVLIALFYTRTLGGCLLHASATALTGYGYSRDIIENRSFLSILPYFGLAILVHSIYNVFAFSAIIFNQFIGVTLAILFAISMIIWIRKEIRLIDYEGEG